MDLLLTIAHSLAPAIAEAQNQSSQFVPLSDGFMQLIGNNVSLDTDGFGPFVNSVFKLSIRIAGAVAVAVFVWGGITYMTQPFGVSEGGVGEAKARMQNAVLGLLMLLATWVIFNQINPDILNLKINAAPLQAIPTQTSEPTSTTTYSNNGAAEVRDNKTGECFKYGETDPDTGVAPLIPC
jgi:hypothetical protein